MGFILGKTGEEGNRAELIRGKASGTFTRVKVKNRPISGRCILSHSPRNNVWTHIGSSFLLVFQVGN